MRDLESKIWKLREDTACHAGTASCSKKTTLLSSMSDRRLLRELANFPACPRPTIVVLVPDIELVDFKGLLTTQRVVKGIFVTRDFLVNRDFHSSCET